MSVLLLTSFLLLVAILPLLLSLRTTELAGIEQICAACASAALSIGILMTSGSLTPAWLATTLSGSLMIGAGLLSLSGLRLFLGARPLSPAILAVTLAGGALGSLLFGKALGYTPGSVVIGAGLSGIAFLCTGVSMLVSRRRRARLTPYILVCSAIALAVAALHGVRVATALAGIDLMVTSQRADVWVTATQSVRILLVPLFFLSLVVMLHGAVILSLRELVDTDETTGALSRRTFLDAFETRLHGEREGLAFLLLDLDRFKQINDRYGHVAGDEALLHFAERVRAVLGLEHPFGRLGGEEFGIVLTGTTMAEVRRIAENICRGLRDSSVRDGRPGDFTVTVSIGIALAEEEDGTVDLMARADAALYAAKEAGRDCVRFSEDRLEAALSEARAALADAAVRMRDDYLHREKQRYGAS